MKACGTIFQSVCIYKPLPHHYLIIYYYATQEAHIGFAPFVSCVFFLLLGWIYELYFEISFSIMLPFKMLINNNNRGLGACPQWKWKFILTQPSP